MSAYDPAVYSNVVVLHYVRANSEHFCYAALESFKDGEQCNGMHGDCATLSMPLGTTPMCHTQAHVMCLFAWQGIVSHASTFRRLKNSTLAIALSSQTRSRMPQNFLKTERWNDALRTLIGRRLPFRHHPECIKWARARSTIHTVRWGTKQGHPWFATLYGDDPFFLLPGPHIAEWGARGYRSLTWPKSKIWQVVARPAPLAPTPNNLGLTVVTHHERESGP